MEDQGAEFPFFAFLAREFTELRRRLIWCLVCVLLLSVILLGLPSWEHSFTVQFSDWLRAALLPQGARLIFLSPLEPMAQMIKLGMILAVLGSAPVICWHVVAFTLPAMAPGYHGFYIRFMVLAVLLFAAGLAFSGWVLAPLTLKMLISYGEAAGGVAQLSFERFYSFMTLFLLTFAAPFEIPLVIGFLHRFNLVEAGFFRSHRLQVYGVLMLVSQFVTPDPIVTPLIFTAMGVVLFEFGLILSKWL